MKSVLIITEDSYGCDFFKNIIKRLDLDLRPDCHQVPAKSAKRGRIANASNADKIIVTVDGDGSKNINSVHEEQMNIIKKAIKANGMFDKIKMKLSIIVFEWEVEEWITASLGINASGVKPSDVLRTRIGYEKRDLPFFAEKLNFKSLRSVKSFSDFEKAITDP
ncbi:MAG: hypothetical protein ACP5LX_06665 [Nitrososphaeria archaeon]